MILKRLCQSKGRDRSLLSSDRKKARGEKKQIHFLKNVNFVSWPWPYGLIGITRIGYVEKNFPQNLHISLRRRSQKKQEKKIIVRTKLQENRRFF